MLYYLWNVCQELFLLTTCVTLTHVLLRRTFGKTAAKIHGIARGVGCAAAAGYSTLKLTSNFILTSIWNHHMYAVIIGFTLVYFILSNIFGRRENTSWSLGALFTTLAGAGFSVALILYKLPVVMMFPFNFNTMGNGFFSEYYMVRLAGWALALVALLIYARLLAACAGNLRRFPVLRIVQYVGIWAYAIYCAGRFLVPWVARAKWLGWSVRYSSSKHAFWGALERFASQHMIVFLWVGAALAAVLAVLLLIQSAKVTDFYENSAQLRKLRARNRRYRRSAIALLVMVALIMATVTLVKAYDTQEVTLSEPETYTVDGDRILIPVEMVNDGHLHRFEYKTENNINVRWIVVKKPGSASFGVGLDACEVCGNAGYYERSGQVVCKRCDVVMNINTIGFKGGCNPIPLNYEMADGTLIFSLEDLIAAEKQFR